MDWTYIAAPFLAWLVAGALKFLINSLRAGKPAFAAVGLGGFPSNHSTIVSTVTTLIAWREGFGPVFAVALTLAFIVMLDALDLRRRLGQQAVALNLLAQRSGQDLALREKVGHTPLEVLGGIALGILLGGLLSQL
ncbi:MAG: divergent PAP2 family protein [Nevskiales bacterium]